MNDEELPVVSHENGGNINCFCNRIFINRSLRLAPLPG